MLHVSEIVPKHVHMSLNADINLDREENDIVQYTITVDMYAFVLLSVLCIEYPFRFYLPLLSPTVLNCMQMHGI